MRYNYNDHLCASECELMDCSNTWDGIAVFAFDDMKVSATFDLREDETSLLYVK